MLLSVISEKPMTDKQYNILSKIFFSLSLALGAFSLYYAISPTVFLSASDYLVIGIFVITFLYSGVRLKNKTELKQSKKNKVTKTAHIIAFLYYAVILICEIWFNAYSNRLSGFSATEHFTKYRLMPFETVTHVIGLYKRNLNFGYLLSNLLGNFLIYMPLSYFLPYFFKKMRKTLPFSAVLLLITSFIEVTQAFFCLGEFDTDDILFNFVGAFVFYIIIMRSRIFAKN